MDKLRKASPYSEDGIYNVLYSHLVKEWQGLSMVEGIKEKKNFSNFLRDLIKESLLISELSFEDVLIEHVNNVKKKRIEKKSENNARSIETKKIEDLHKRLRSQFVKNKNFNILEFKNKIKIDLKTRYKGHELILPKKLSMVSEFNIEEDLKKIRDTKYERMSSFKGLSYKYNKSFHFIDEVSAPIVYYNKKENNQSELDSLLIGVISYSLKINKIKNTKKIIKKLHDIEQNDWKHNNPSFSFFPFDKDEFISKRKNKREKLNYKEEDKNEINKIIMKKNKDP